MTQADLFLKPIDARFKAFHGSNPKVYKLFVAFTERFKERGFKRVGAKFIWESIRYECGPDTNGRPFVLNNSYVSRYVRLAVKDRPDLAGLFETRSLKS